MHEVRNQRGFSTTQSTSAHVTVDTTERQDVHGIVGKYIRILLAQSLMLVHLITANGTVPPTSLSTCVSK